MSQIDIINICTNDIFNRYVSSSITFDAFKTAFTNILNAYGKDLSVDFKKIILFLAESYRRGYIKENQFFDMFERILNSKFQPRYAVKVKYGDYSCEKLFSDIFGECSEFANNLRDILMQTKCKYKCFRMQETVLYCAFMTPNGVKLVPGNIVEAEVYSRNLDINKTTESLRLQATFSNFSGTGHYFVVPSGRSVKTEDYNDFICYLSESYYY